jgi:uncharacterized protein YpmS
MFEGCTGCCLGTVLLLLLCCVLAVCGAIYVVTASPDPPLTDNFKADPGQAAAFDAAINRAASDAAISRGFTLTFTEQQISSWLALEGKAFADEHGFSYPFENVQMELEDGEMVFYGELGSGRVNIPLQVIFVPKVDRANHFDLNVDSVNFAGLNLPGALIDDLANQLEEKVIQPIKDAGTNYYLDPNSLSVENGTFTVRGQVY